MSDSRRDLMFQSQGTIRHLSSWLVLKTLAEVHWMQFIFIRSLHFALCGADRNITNHEWWSIKTFEFLFSYCGTGADIYSNLLYKHHPRSHKCWTHTPSRASSAQCDRSAGGILVLVLCLAAHLGCRNLSRKSGNCEAKGIGERCPVLPTNSLAHSHPCPLFIKCLLSSPLFSRVKSGVTCFMEKNDWCDIFLRHLNVNLRYFSCAFKL